MFGCLRHNSIYTHRSVIFNRSSSRVASLRGWAESERWEVDHRDGRRLISKLGGRLAPNIGWIVK